MSKYIFTIMEGKIMSEVEIYNQLSLSLNTTALFGLVWAFLLWVAGRSASVALENNAGILMKIAVTVFGLVSLYQFNVALSWVRFIILIHYLISQLALMSKQALLVLDLQFLQLEK